MNRLDRQRHTINQETRTVETSPPPERQYGTVLVFRSHVTIEEITKALAKIKDVTEYTTGIAEFNPDHGGPVWYIP